MATKSTKGNCTLCGYCGTKGSMTQHLKKCIPENDPPNGELSRLSHLRVESKPFYWLDLEIRSDSKLTELDDFLREIWLECCGHLSAFHFGEVIYVSPTDEPLDLWPGAYVMDTPAAGLFHPVGTEFIHEYDFGTTTRLNLRVQGEREGPTNGPPVRLLARNEAPLCPCDICSQPATLICTVCSSEELLFYCDRHSHRHEHHDEFFLPVVNSPRMGICDYSG